MNLHFLPKTSRNIELPGVWCSSHLLGKLLGRAPTKPTRYVSQRADGWQYQRWVPEKLQAAVGYKVLTAWLGDKGRAAAEQRAQELGGEHGRLFASLKALSDAERQL